MSQQSPQKKRQSPKDPSSAAVHSTVLSIETDTAEPGRIFLAIQELARLLTQAPGDNPEVLGLDEDMAIAYHLHVRLGGQTIEYRNTVTLPSLLSPDNAVDALDMIESQLDLATRPAKNFAMRVLRESKEMTGGLPLRLS